MEPGHARRFVDLFAGAARAAAQTAEAPTATTASAVVVAPQATVGHLAPQAIPQAMVGHAAPQAMVGHAAPAVGQRVRAKFQAQSIGSYLSRWYAGAISVMQRRWHPLDRLTG